MVCFSTSLKRIQTLLSFPKEDMYENKTYAVREDFIIQHKGGMHFRILQGDAKVISIKNAGIAISVYTEKAEITKEGKVKGEREQARKDKAHNYGIVKVKPSQIRHINDMDNYEQESLDRLEEDMKLFQEEVNSRNKT